VEQSSSGEKRMQNKITIEIDGRRHEIEWPVVTGREVKDLAQRLDGHAYVINGEHRQALGDDEKVEIQDGKRFEVCVEASFGGEVVVFEVDTTTCETRKHELNGLDIKDLARKPPANILYLIERREGHPYRREVGDAEFVNVRDGEHFVTEPPVGKTS
jgi:hypothetical protein